MRRILLYGLYAVGAVYALAALVRFYGYVLEGLLVVSGIVFLALLVLTVVGAVLIWANGGVV